MWQIHSILLQPVPSVSPRNKTQVGAAFSFYVVCIIKKKKLRFVFVYVNQLTPAWAGHCTPFHQNEHILFRTQHLLLLTLQLLLGELLLCGLIVGGLGDNLLLLGEDDLDVAWGRHVGVDATMGTVGATTQALSAVHLNVIDDQTINIESSVVSIGLSVAQQLQQKLGGLLWPATLCGLPLLGLSATADATVETAEWHALLLVDDSLQETLGTTQGHALDGLCGLVRVLQQEDTTLIHNSIIHSPEGERGWKSVLESDLSLCATLQVETSTLRALRRCFNMAGDLIWAQQHIMMIMISTTI